MKTSREIVSKLSTYLCCFSVLIGIFSLSNLSLSMKTIIDLNINWYFSLNKSRNSQLNFPLQSYHQLPECMHHSVFTTLFYICTTWIHKYEKKKLYLQDYLESHPAGCLNLRYNGRNKSKLTIKHLIEYEQCTFLCQ